MSISLLKKSLAIVEDSPPENEKKVETKDKKISNKPKSRKRKNVDIDEILQSKREDKRAIVEDILKSRKVDQTKANIEKLLKLSSLTEVRIDEKSTEKIIRRARTGHYIVPEEKPKEEVESIFTEEDFRKFEREYFPS